MQGFRVEGKHFADFARSGFTAIGDDVGGHGGAKSSVAFVNVLNGAFALVAAGQIEIDVRPFAAFCRKKTFEKQIHSDRINRSDSECVTDGAIRGGTAALNENVLLA